MQRLSQRIAAIEQLREAADEVRRAGPPISAEQARIVYEQTMLRPCTGAEPSVFEGMLPIDASRLYCQLMSSAAALDRSWVQP